MIVINNRNDRPLRVFQIWRGVTENQFITGWVCGDIEVAHMDEPAHRIVFGLRQCALPFEYLFKVIEAFNPDTEQFYREV